MPVAEDAVAAGAKALWLQSGVVNEEAAAYAREHGLTVVMDRCIKVDYASLVGRQGCQPAATYFDPTARRRYGPLFAVPP